MGYDIPDEIKYTEKIIWKMDWKQLAYAVLFGALALISFKLPIEGQLKFVIPALFAFSGLGFIALNLEAKVLAIMSYFLNVKRATANSIAAQKFFEVKKIENNAVYLENKKILGILQVEPINFYLLDDARKRVLMENYKVFLNHLTNPIQILVRTVPVEGEKYFENTQINQKKEFAELFLDFQSFQTQFIKKNSVRKRLFYMIVPSFLKTNEEEQLKELEDNLKIMQEKLTYCGLTNRQLTDEELHNFYLSYSTSATDSEAKEITVKEEKESSDVFRSFITPALEFRPDYAQINSEFHKIVRINGYPRKIEDGWLQSFLSKNEDYDISLHVHPSSINSMLSYLHNQIIQQNADLYSSTAKGTPNPALETKLKDTKMVYDNLYKGEEKLFGLSLYVDNKAPALKSLRLLTEKCKANLNGMLMIPEVAKWNIADSVKSTMPLANDKLFLNREFPTSCLSATFPFISPVDSNMNGMLFANEVETLNPIFVDFDSMSNKHFFLIGISGAGKSYTAKYVMMQKLFKEETKIYVLDPNGEYRGLCNKLGGQAIELSKDSMINLFDLGNQDLGSKMLSLISAFDIIVGGLSESQKALLNKVLIQAYSENKSPTFSDIKKILEQMQKGQRDLQDRSIDVLLNRVTMYSKGGFFEFLDSRGNVDSGNPIQCFDLSKLPDAVKTLMMFTVLQHITIEMKRDRKPKLILIDEGWSLLRSKEASGYILEFIKTARKYNASIGFITQEIDDLLNNESGRSVLNTTSTKILMRQNPSNLNLISKCLNLNTFEENYLLTAQRGKGLLITETGRYKFFITVPENLHELITTNPIEMKNEGAKPTKKIAKKKTLKVNLDLEKGLYIKKDLTVDEIGYLVENGYKQHDDRLTQAGASIEYLVRKDDHETLKHAFMVWFTVNELRKYFKKIETFATAGPDIVVETKKGKICFEIETGTLIKGEKPEEIYKRFGELQRNYYKFFIVVASQDWARKYKNYGTTIPQLELADFVKGLK